MLADAYQISVQFVLVFVDAVFVFLDLFLNVLVILEQHSDGKLHGFFGEFAHFDGHAVTYFNGNSRGCQQGARPA